MNQHTDTTRTATQYQENLAGFHEKLAWVKEYL